MTNRTYIVQPVHVIFDSAFPEEQKHLAEAIQADWSNKAFIERKIAIIFPNTYQADNGSYDASECVLLDTYDQATQYLIEEEIL